MAVLLWLLILSAFHAVTLAQQRKFNITLGSSLTPTTNSSWFSPSRRFALGFYEQTNGYAVGIYIVGMPNKTAVWTANRNSPVVPSNTVLLLTNDGRLIVKVGNQEISVINPSRAIASASLMDTGNFVLYDSDRNVIWQSFDNPTNTLLPGQHISVGQELFSGASETDDSLGIFRLKMQDDGNLVQYPVNTADSAPYAYYTSYTGGFGNNVSLNLDDDSLLYLFNSTNSLKNLTKGGYRRERTIIYMMKIDADGNWSAGCERNFTTETCQLKENTSKYYDMRTVENTGWEDSTYVVLAVTTKEDCEQACLQDCNCEAASFKDSVYKAKAAFEESRSAQLSEDVAPRAFSYAELEQATSGFKEALGRGAFGTVFKGILAEGQKVIAVKRLEKELVEGETEFQTEIKIIGKTHHRNLVRLLGYCLDGSRRLLVYEYMTNGSLADILFTPEKQPTWEERCGFARYIARGLLYLHDECDTQIIHCDIKPQNILVDDQFCAKISDFGMAKLLKKDQTRTYTGIRGTRGNVAPEWHRNLPVTVKADIYSFGVVLLELICRRKYVDLSLNENEAILEYWVYNCFDAGELDKLVRDEGVDKRQFERMVKISIWCNQDDSSLCPSMKKVLLMLEGTVEIPVPPSPSSFLIFLGAFRARVRGLPDERAVLLLTSDGRLIVKVGSQEISVINPSRAIASASMLDTGNFVLYNSDHSIIWQSFDNPTNTLLPGQHISARQELFSSASEADDSLGIFHLKMQDDGNLVQYPVNTLDTAPYAYYSTRTSGVGNNVTLNLDDDGLLYLHNSPNRLRNLTRGGYRRERTIIYMLKIDAGGILRVYSHSLNQQNSSVIWSSTDDRCIPKGLCGPNGFCTNIDDQAKCLCLPGFDFVMPGNWSAGCERNFTAETCRLKENTSKYYDMRTIENTVWEDSTYVVLGGTTKEDCEQACLQDCNCEAALFKDRECRKQRLPLRYGRRDLGNSNLILVKVGVNFIPNEGVPNQTVEETKGKRLNIGILIAGITLTVFALLVLGISEFLIHIRKFY
ncbi:hypothetical protein KY284_007408 [Solanum tuberosum]|nr:hypothetical protein KY284_007408 [Solanum tuberosum]